jgi:protein-S-isoprenylcysteine O-methyltransferase Ste14
VKPLPFVWPYAILFWIVYFWTFAPEFGIVRRAQRSVSSTDSKSFQVIMLGLFVALFAAFVLAWTPRFQLAGTQRVVAFWVGTAMMVSGSLLRRHCWRMLGTSFTGDVQARPDQQVVTRGAYSKLRHPSYTGAILINTGMGIALGTWAGALLLLVASFAVYGYRISVEERALLAAIGEPYREFMINRKRLIPFVY